MSTIKNREIKIVVGMSGGVDSTMSAFLLKQKGYDVIGVTMKIWKGETGLDMKRAGCYGPGEEADIRDAIEACKQIGIPHHTVDLRDEYDKNVLQYFCNEYKKGKTPNPCVFCNAKIKFNLLLKKVFNLGINFDYFATGHYANIKLDKNTNRYILLKGKDNSKDQSYFLYRLKQVQLKKIIFPLGSKTKKEVRELAVKNGFRKYAEKKESQNFVECDDYAYLIGFEEKGKIINKDGDNLGEHNGISHYTIGQRKKLRIGGLKDPYYVSKIDSTKNVITVGPRESIFSNSVSIKNINWIVDPKLVNDEIRVKLRYNMKPIKSTFILKNKKEVILKFSKPQFAVAPGQSAVFYNNNNVIVGGGIITDKF